MAPRANWKGFLRLSLVTCPIALFPATSESEKISFNQINKKIDDLYLVPPYYIVPDGKVGHDAMLSSARRSVRSTRWRLRGSC